MLLGYLSGVRLEDFLHSFSVGEYQGIPIDYVPPEFEEFINNTVEEWELLGMLRKWEGRRSGDPLTPSVVSPLGVEPSKPRALSDGRYVNKFCWNLPFSMDNAAKVAEVAWGDVYFFKID